MSLRLQTQTPARHLTPSPLSGICMQRQQAALLQAIWRSTTEIARNSAVFSNRTCTLLPSLTSWTTRLQVPFRRPLSTYTAGQLQQTTLLSSHHQRGFAAQAQARPQLRKQTPQRKIDPSGVQGLYLVAFTVAMIGVTYASVPLYRMFCQATGYGGTVQQGSTGTYNYTNPADGVTQQPCQ